MNRQQLSARANVILTLEKITQGQSLTTLLDDLFANIKESERAFTHELLLGTLRHWHALSRIGESLIKEPPSDQAIVCTLNMGLYELLYMHTPDYAIINETLNALKSLNKNYGVGLVNAILRKVAKSKDKYFKKTNKNHSLPNWLAKQLKQDWGQYYDVLCEHLRQVAPIFVRVNQRQSDVESYAKILASQDIAHSIVPLGIGGEQTIRLDGAVKIANLPHFADGWLMVQDLHAQLSAHLLTDVVKERNVQILDICAAPGGKTAHLLEKFHVKHLIALDNDGKRLNRVQENLQRLRLIDDKIALIEADARSWQADELYDVVLLDAPCTATGVIRRHPDITLLRQPDDVVQTVQLQSQILANAWKQLKVGGVLLYATCSLLKAENETQITTFVADRKDVQVLDFTLDLPNQIKQQIGYQCLPLDAYSGDGFYYALLQKLA